MRSTARTESVLRHSPVTRPVVTVAIEAVKEAFLLRPEVRHGDISQLAVGFA